MKISINLTSTASSADPTIDRIVDNLVSLARQATYDEQVWRGDGETPVPTEKQKKLEALTKADKLLTAIRAKIQELYAKERGMKEADKVRIRAMITGLKKRANEINAPFAANGKPLYQV